MARGLKRFLSYSQGYGAPLGTITLAEYGSPLDTVFRPSKLESYGKTTNKNDAKLTNDAGKVETVKNYGKNVMVANVIEDDSNSEGRRLNI